MKLNIGTPAVPAGVYQATYEGGEDLETDFGTAYKLKFKVVGGEFDGKETSRLVNPESTSPKSNVVKFFAGLAGKDPEAGIAIDDEDFVGNLYEILVENHKEGFTKVASIIRRLYGTDDKSPNLDSESKCPF